MIGVPSTLPKRELLTSQRGTDNLWHAHYPTAGRTLCGRDVLPFKRGRKWLPDCGVCAKTACAWHAVEPCMPAHWLPEIDEVAAA